MGPSWIAALHTKDLSGAHFFSIFYSFAPPRSKKYKKIRAWQSNEELLGNVGNLRGFFCGFLFLAFIFFQVLYRYSFSAGPFFLGKRAQKNVRRALDSN
jgi:hypothetical protein